MNGINDFFYRLPDLMKREGKGATQEQMILDFNTACKTMVNNVDELIALNRSLIDQQNTMLNWINDLQERHARLFDTVCEICPGLMVIDEVSENDEERKTLLRKYMHTAVDSDDEEDILDWVIKQE